MFLRKFSLLLIVAISYLGTTPAKAQEFMESYPFYSDDLGEPVIIPCVVGVLLTSDPSDILSAGTECVVGLQIRNLCVPGGEWKLRDYLTPKFQCRSFTQSHVLELKYEIMRYYRDNNYPFVVVEIPEQDVTDGVIQFIVRPSVLGNITTLGNDWFNSDCLIRNVHLCPCCPINTQVLFNDVAWMNRNPFRHTDVVFLPGDIDGTTDIQLVTRDRLPLRVYVGADNTGTDVTYNERFYTGLVWGNVFGWDHTFLYELRFSPDFTTFRSHTFHYTAPLPWQNVFVMYGGYARVRPEIDDFFSKGHNTQVSGRYYMPFFTNEGWMINEAVIGFDYKSGNSFLQFVSGIEELVVEIGPANVLDSDYNIGQFVLGWSTGIDWCRHLLTLDAQIFWSPGQMFEHQSKKHFEAFREGVDSHYVYGRFTGGYQYVMASGASLASLVQFQLASTGLLPPEQFGLGGYDTVRGYDNRIFNADDAVCVNLELRMPPLTIARPLGFHCLNDEFIFLVFFDYGWGKIKDASCGHFDTNESLMSIGPGLRYAINPYFTARLDWGFQLRKVEFQSGRRNRFEFGLTASF